MMKMEKAILDGLYSSGCLCIYIYICSAFIVRDGAKAIPCLKEGYSGFCFPRTQHSENIYDIDKYIQFLRRG